ncbi:MAG: Uma2 family endonuclease [Acidobacteria bacterium]|nr:Uma2 family endonuclease [Acidobacteriota bacterium]
MISKATLTIEDLIKQLSQTEEKAEIVNGEVVKMPATGFLPGRASGRIYRSLDDYEELTGSGYAIPDNVGFIVNLPNRNSFSPDASFYTGPPTGAKFIDGAPTFAAEVRSEWDYGKKAEREIAEKIADYFASGTIVVWDVDVLQEKIVRVYRRDDPGNPTIYRRGEIAEAEPAVPGWRMPVDELFR